MSTITPPPYPPEHYSDQCPDCGETVLFRYLEPDPAGWFAVYDHCDGVWTAGFDA